MDLTKRQPAAFLLNLLLQRHELAHQLRREPFNLAEVQHQWPMAGLFSQAAQLSAERLQLLFVQEVARREACDRDVANLLEFQPALILLPYHELILRLYQPTPQEVPDLFYSAP